MRNNQKAKALKNAIVGMVSSAGMTFYGVTLVSHADATAQATAYPIFGLLSASMHMLIGLGFNPAWVSDQQNSIKVPLAEGAFIGVIANGLQSAILAGLTAETGPTALATLFASLGFAVAISISGTLIFWKATAPSNQEITEATPLNSDNQDQTPDRPSRTCGAGLLQWFRNLTSQNTTTEAQPNNSNNLTQ